MSILARRQINAIVDTRNIPHFHDLRHLRMPVNFRNSRGPEQRVNDAMIYFSGAPIKEA